MTTFGRQSWRFLLVGGSNTVATFLLLAVLAQFLDHWIAYTAAFTVGMTYTAIMTGRFVFSARVTKGRTVAFVLWYLGVYLIGLLVVQIIDSGGSRSGLVVAFGTVLVTAPLGFLGGRLIYHRSPRVGTEPRTLQ